MAASGARSLWASIWGSTPVRAYFPVPTESPISSTSGRSSQTQRRGLRSFRRPLILGVLVIGLLIAVLWDFHRPSSATQDLWRQSGFLQSSYSSAGKKSQHREPVSVILMAGKNDHQVLESARSVLATTVGPYELIGIFTDPSDQSQRIVDLLVEHHRNARIDQLGRGMTKYTSLNISSESDFALHKALDKAKYGYVGIVNANDQLVEYGWDRILLTALKSSETLIAVSGRAGANFKSSASHLEITDVEGQLYPFNHETVASPPSLEIRNVALRSPILYDVEQVLSAGGWMGKDSEKAGFGDVEVCLRGAVHGLQCAFYPISTKRLISAREVWKPVPGQLVLDQDMGTSISLDVFKMGGRTEVERLLRHAEAAVYTVQAIPRQAEDVPRTIVTAFSGNHQRTIQQWYHSLHLAPHTRYIVYILPSEVPILPEATEGWENVELRTFDFTRHPAWMDVSVNRGEYAWKPLIVEEVMRDYGGLVFWMDSGDIIEKNFDETWNEVARRGMLAGPVGGPVRLWLHPAMLAYLDFPDSLMDNENCNGAMWGVNSQHYDSMVKITRPMMDCARTRACIAPLGSSRENHRQDQASFSALIHLHGYRCDYRMPIRMGGDAPGDGSKFCEDGREC